MSAKGTRRYRRSRGTASKNERRGRSTASLVFARDEGDRKREGTSARERLLTRPLCLVRFCFPAVLLIERKKERKKERKSSSSSSLVLTNYAHFCRLRECGSLGQFYRYLIVRVFITGLETRDDDDHRFKFQNTNATTRDDERRREGKEKKKEKKKEEHRARAYRLFPALERRTRRRRWWCCCSWGSSCSLVCGSKFSQSACWTAFVRENAFSFETKHHTHVIRARL